MTSWITYDLGLEWLIVMLNYGKKSNWYVSELHNDFDVSQFQISFQNNNCLLKIIFFLCKDCKHNLQQQHNIQLSKDSGMMLHIVKHYWLNCWSWEYFHFCHSVHCYLGIMDSVQSMKHIRALCFNCPQSLSSAEWFTWRIHWMNNYKSL